MQDARSKASSTDISRANTFPWPPVLLVAAIATAIGLGIWAPLAWPGYDDWPARVVGWGFGLIGLALIASAAWALSSHDTTILPHGTARKLVTSGPYVRFRNPIYLGEVFVLFAAAEMTKNIWFVIAAFVFAGLITWLQILPEERHLEERFGADFRDYVNRSKRWL